MKFCMLYCETLGYFHDKFQLSMINFIAYNVENLRFAN